MNNLRKFQLFTIKKFYGDNCLLIKVSQQSIGQVKNRTKSDLACINNMVNKYNKQKHLCLSYSYSQRINPKGVFTNNELDLNDVQVYGFDYDYTLAYYNKNLFRLIFNLALNALINNYKYPKEIESFVYIPVFPARGLHFDKRNGWLMKIDSYHNIQLGTVFHGMRQVTDEKVKEFYNGTHVSIEDIGFTQSSPTMHHFIDLFCLPEICLIAMIIDYFNSKSIQFSPDYVFEDVQDAVRSLHKSELLHRSITQSIHEYVLPLDPENKYEECRKIKEFLVRLKKSNKNTFLITNSKFWFVNMGMSVLCGPDWTDLFDVIICSARKPNFFSSKTKPFRQYYTDKNVKSWDRVTKLEKGSIYYEGNLFELLQHTGWYQSKVLYFGDNLYSDLAEPFLKHGWRTGAIIHELQSEIQNHNTSEFQRTVKWLVTLEDLIQQLMLINDYTDQNVLLEKNSLITSLFQEREVLRKQAKNVFNPYFGSIFRTYNNPTFFSRRLSRFADIYTSNLVNLLEYPINYHFIPRRIDLAHENSTSINIAHVPQILTHEFYSNGPSK